MVDKPKASIALETARVRPVFPLSKHGKTPLIPKGRGGNGHLDATQDLEQVASWWRGSPEANIGCPVLEGELVLDIDPRNGGEESAAKLDELSPRWRETRTHETRSGGWQYFYALPADITSDDLRGKLDGFPGIDVRKHGNYILAPGSEVSLTDLGKDGTGSYTVARNGVPASAPDEIIAMLKRERPTSSAVPGVNVEADALTEYGRAALDDECKTLAEAEPGTRDIQMATVACFNVGQLVAGGHVPFAVAVECITAAALEAGLTQPEVEKVPAKIREGAESGARGPGVTPLSIDDLLAESTTDALQPLEIPDGGFVRAMVDLIGPYTEASDAGIALAAMAAISGIVGWRCTLTWAESTEPVTLMLLLVGLSALGRKTTSANSSVRVIQEAGVESLFTHRTGHMSGRGLVELYTEAQAFDEDDEYMQRIFDESSRKDFPRGVLLLVDEFGQMLSDDKWRAETLTQLLGMYSGHHGGITTGAKKAPGGRCALALLGTVTTDELARVLTGEHGRSGMLGRFLIATGDENKPKLYVPPPRLDGYEALREKCLSWLRRLGGWSGNLGNAYDLLDADALEAYVDWARTTDEAVTRSGDALAVALHKRGQSKVIKLATIFAICEVPDPARMSPTTVIVTRRHVEMAIGMEQRSMDAALELVKRQHLAQGDRYADSIYSWLGNDRDGSERLGKVLERGVPREPGDKTYTRAEKTDILKRDPRFEIEKGASGKGQRVRVRQD